MQQKESWNKMRQPLNKKNPEILSLNQSLQTIVPISSNQSLHWTHRAKLIQQAFLIHHQFMKAAKFSQKKLMNIYCKIRLKQTTKGRTWKLCTQNLNQVRPANQLKLVLKKRNCARCSTGSMLWYCIFSFR